MYKFGDEIQLINDVKILIKGIFPVEKKYSIEIGGLVKRIDEDILGLLVSKFKVPEKEEIQDIAVLEEDKPVNEVVKKRRNK